MLGAAHGDRLASMAVLVLGSLLSAVYLLPVVVRAFFRDPPGEPGGAPSGLREAPVLCVLPPCLTAAGCLALFFLAPAIRELLFSMLGG